MYNQSHGHSKGGKTSPTYNSWKNMRSRCFNKSNQDYRHYGGRGITVCDRWMKFDNFLSDMGKKPIGKTLDRRNNNGNYTPKNCRWVTQKVQMSNTRKNVFLSYGGKRLHISEWARLIGTDPTVLDYRHKQGWSDRQVITRPIGRWSWDKRRHYVSWKGNRKSTLEWARDAGIKHTTLLYRLKAGWKLSKVFANAAV